MPRLLLITLALTAACTPAAEPPPRTAADLAGTWALRGDTVTISPRGPSLLRFTQFTAARDQLTGERLLSGETLRLVLTRDE